MKRLPKNRPQQQKLPKLQKQRLQNPKHRPKRPKQQKSPSKKLNNPMYPPFHRLIMKIARMKIRNVQGKEYLPTDGGFIVVANHPNWLDPLFLGAVLFDATGRHFRFLASSARHR